jgi:hypothetical protein
MALTTDEVEAIGEASIAVSVFSVLGSAFIICCYLVSARPLRRVLCRGVPSVTEVVFTSSRLSGLC